MIDTLPFWLLCYLGHDRNPLDGNGQSGQQWSRSTVVEGSRPQRPGEFRQGRQGSRLYYEAPTGFPWGWVAGLADCNLRVCKSFSSLLSVPSDPYLYTSRTMVAFCTFGVVQSFGVYQDYYGVSSQFLFAGTWPNPMLCYFIFNSEWVWPSTVRHKSV